ncbi:hypothetical protein ACQ86B_22365 [Mycolicibacterium aichiense]|uniref:hypothetical protein n=1 Tax=Mycolicibacterium aichiense TaxID=1799 RepID=UPI003D66CAFE
MTAAVGATTWTVRLRDGLRCVCAAGVAATMLAAGWGNVAPDEVGRPHVGRVAELEAILAASVTSTAVDAVALASTTTAANSVGTHRSSTASLTVVVPEPIYNFVQGLVVTGAAALLAPAWYLGFPVTLTGSAAFVYVLMRPFVAAAGGTMTPVLTGFAVATGALIYALLPPALIVAGLMQAASAVSRAISLPAAAPSAGRVARVASARDVPAGTGRSGRAIAAARTQSANAVPSRTAAAVPAKGRAVSPTSGAPSKKSTSTGGAKRAVGGSGRNR